MDTYYCSIWACIVSVALNGGLGVILTSAVLGTVENSRIKACVHRENANWLNPTAHNAPLFSPSYILWAQHPLFYPCWNKKQSQFSAGPFPHLSGDHYIFTETLRLCVKQQEGKGMLFCTSVHTRTLVHRESTIFTTGWRVKVRCIISTRCEGKIITSLSFKALHILIFGKSERTC